MDKLLRMRTPLRAAFTRTVNILKEEMKRETVDNGVLKDKIEKLKTLSEDLREQDKIIFNALLDKKDVTDDEINREAENTEEYFDTFITIKRVVNEFLFNGTDESRSNKPENLNGANRMRNFKLPRVELVKFDGELINFLPFWSQFQKINEDEELNECDKFHYLVQAMKPGTRAREFIDSYPITADNYEKALTALKERFGKKDLLTEVYVRELLKLIVHNVGNQKEKLPLSKLVDKLEAYLRSLDSMGLEREANAAWLYPMVESCLAEDTLRAWQRSPVFNDSPEIENLSGDSVQKSRLAQLMEFLHREVQGEERMQLARGNFYQTAQTSQNEERLLRSSKVFERTPEFNYKGKQSNKRFPTATGLYVKDTKKSTCVFCDRSSHESKACRVVLSIPLNERLTKVRETKACLKCLKIGHIAKYCREEFIRCQVCKGPHVTVLCPEVPFQGEKEKMATRKPNTQELVQSTMASNECSREIALMTLEVVIMGDNKKKKVRALLDTGSQRSYIMKSTVVELDLKPISTESLAHTLFGGAQVDEKLHKKFQIEVLRPGSKDPIELECLDQEIICGDVPRVSRPQLFPELKRHKIWLSDVGPGSSDIEVLIGSDFYGKLLTGNVKQLRGGLTAVETKLGWTVCGRTEKPSVTTVNVNSSMFLANFAIGEMKIPELWKLETIGITDPVESLRKKEEENLAYEMFIKDVRRNEEGRYCVSLPWFDRKSPEVPSNKQIAERRLYSTTRKLKTMNKLVDYNKVFLEWQEEGVIEKVPSVTSNKNVHYLPHHPVIKEDSLTTKIRPVFDASCKRGRNPSLNDCLLKGPNLIEQIPAILLRFREKAIGVVSDIRRAFLQIEVREEDRDYLRFLWWEHENRMHEFRHNRVVFGLTSSPFLLGAVIRCHLANAPEDWRSFAQMLSKTFYVDNCISSVEDELELKDFIHKSTTIMSQAKMELRMWEFGPQMAANTNCATLKGLEGSSEISVPVLGLHWNKEEDYLWINPKIELNTSNPSKREILAVTQSIFDPIGFLAPILLPAKLLIQEAWTIKSDWDAPLPENICKNFMKWFKDLDVLPDLKIPRRVGFGDRNSWCIHVFCDASQRAYASVIYLRCEDEEKVSVQLLAAKSRLSPMKKVTIPRMELLGCTLGARLSAFVLEAMNLTSHPVYYWTDSSTALAWIQRNNEWGTFVGNRVKEICKLTNPKGWAFIPGEKNPADLPSRGCNLRQLLASRWWEGPDWLYLPEEKWPSVKAEPNEENISAESKQRKTLSNVVVESSVSKWYQKFSKFSKIIRIFAWIRRFVAKARKQTTVNAISLSAAEIEDAEDEIWRLVQKESFGNVETVCKGVLIIRDERDLIRVKTKIIDSNDEYSLRYPILLPSKHYLINCLISELHLESCHAGLQILAAKLRERYFILSSKRIIRRIVTSCLACKRYNSKACTSPPIHLPLDRVRDAKTFEISGIDICGPLFLKNRTKVWILLYTCAVYRAVHLELVTSLSTDTFLQALRRIIARRGRPSTIYTDNGTNFSGADSAFKRLDWEKIQRTFSSLKPITWKFIPPTAAWWGGWWERLIRSVKALLLRVLGHSSLMYEELSTILCDVEAQINSRPLTYISDGCGDLVPLTPCMFIQDISDIGVPDIDKIDSDRLRVRLKYCQKLREDLRSRFRKEYLGQLVQRAGEKAYELKVGDVVLVGQDNLKRQLWPMAKVVKLFSSRDGHPRVAEVKTKTGTLVRPLKRLYPLEITEPNPIIQVVPEKLSRFGRRIKSPNRLHI